MIADNEKSRATTCTISIGSIAFSRSSSLTTSDNPYASPQVQPPPPPQRAEIEEPRALPSIGKSILKWTLACSIAAGPSFFFGSSLARQTGFPAACAGMIAGIVVFIVLYVLVERTQRVQRILSWRFARRTAWIGYGTRIAASIIFPIGMFPDVFCGMFSLGSVSYTHLTLPTIYSV